MTEKINYFASKAHCETLLKECRDFRLWVSPGFYDTPIDELHRVYNGIGPDRFPAWLRRPLTRLFRWFEAAAFGHDWDYTYLKKTYWNFTKANFRVFWNGAKTGFRFGGIKIGLKLSARSLGLAILCQIGGWRGFKAAVPPTKWRPNVQKGTEKC